MCTLLVGDLRLLGFCCNSGYDVSCGVGITQLFGLFWVGCLNVVEFVLGMCLCAGFGKNTVLGLTR